MIAWAVEHQLLEARQIDGRRNLRDPREINRARDVALGIGLRRLRIDEHELGGFIRESLLHIRGLYKVDRKIRGFGGGVSKTLLPYVILGGGHLRRKSEEP